MGVAEGIGGRSDARSSVFEARRKQQAVDTKAAVVEAPVTVSKVPATAFVPPVIGACADRLKDACWCLTLLLRVCQTPRTAPRKRSPSWRTCSPVRSESVRLGRRCETDGRVM